MFNCSICKSIEDYDITLKSLNMKNNLEKLPEGIKVGIKKEFLNVIEDESELIMPFSLDLIGMFVKNEDFTMDDLKKEIDENDDKIAFKINAIYNLKLILKNDILEQDKNSKELKEYAYFLLEPILKELVASIGGKIGLPGLTLPKRNLKNGNNN